MSAPVEAWADNALLAFDGRVLEVFGFPGGAQSQRFHVWNLRLGVEGPDGEGRYSVAISPQLGSGGVRLDVSGARWPAVGPLLEWVRAALPA